MQALRSTSCALARLCPEAGCALRLSVCAPGVDMPVASSARSSGTAAPSWAQQQHAAQRYMCATSAARAAESASPEAVQQSVFQDQSWRADADARAPGPEADQAGPSPSDEDDHHEKLLKDQLLEAALKHVADKGWSTRAVQLAAEELGYSPMLAGICASSDAEFVRFFIRRCNARLFERIRTEGAAFTMLPPMERAKTAIKWRLQMVSPYISSWPQAMAVMAAPEHIGAAAGLLGELIEGLWAHVGDGSQGAERYAKQLALQVVYTTTELYMLADFSPEHADTWDALDRRLADTAAVRKGLGEAEMALLELRNRAAMFMP